MKSKQCTVRGDAEQFARKRTKMTRKAHVLTEKPRERAHLTSLYVQCKRHFDMLTCLGVDHECDRQTDGRTHRLKSYGAGGPISIKSTT